MFVIFNAHHVVCMNIFYVYIPKNGIYIFFLFVFLYGRILFYSNVKNEFTLLSVLFGISSGLICK